MKSVISSALIILLAAACSSGDQVVPSIYDGPTADGGSAPAPDPEPDPEPDPGLEDPPEEPPEEPDEPETVFEDCATQYDEAKLKPLDMVLMLDRSGSMADAGKWTAATTAIQQFAAHPSSDGIAVSLSYFPETYTNVCLPCGGTCGICFNGCCALPTGELCWIDSDCDSGGICYGFMCHAGGGNATCDAGDYAQPEVPMATLPGAAGQLNLSMANVQPVGGTPTGPALEGALAYAADLKAQVNTGADDVVVVLATDGEPTECQPQGIGEVAQIAADAATGLDGIPTFVIGVGANLFNLNAIAAAGGTQAAYLVDANTNATQSFVDTLNEIRRIAVACQYVIPDVGSETIAYDMVNVGYSQNGAPLQAVPKVANEGACSNVSYGWYYDDPVTPKSIVMCPATCEMLQGSETTQIEIVYGCETIIT